MPTYTLAPDAYQQFFDDNGDPLSGGKLYTYASGLATPAVTYLDSAGTQNTNPITLDAGGRAVIYLAPTSYKFILTDASLVPVGPTMDPVTAVGAGTSGLGTIFVFGGQSSSPVTATSYASGTAFYTLHPGTAVYEVDSATLSGTYVISFTGVTEAGTTLTVALVNLSDGAYDTPIATAVLAPDVNGGIGTSGAITFGAGGSLKRYGIKAKVDTGSAYFWGCILVRTT